MDEMEAVEEPEGRKEVEDGRCRCFRFLVLANGRSTTTSQP